MNKFLMATLIALSTLITTQAFAQAWCLDAGNGYERCCSVRRKTGDTVCGVRKKTTYTCSLKCRIDTTAITDIFNGHEDAESFKQNCLASGGQVNEVDHVQCTRLDQETSLVCTKSFSGFTIKTGYSPFEGEAKTKAMQECYNGSAYSNVPYCGGSQKNTVDEDSIKCSVEVAQ